MCQFQEYALFNGKKFSDLVKALNFVSLEFCLNVLEFIPLFSKTVSPMIFFKTFHVNDVLDQKIDQNPPFQGHLAFLTINDDV